MGIVAKQSVQNIFSIGAGVLLGALNTLFLYPVFLGSQLQGLVVALLSVSNLLQPFISVGLQHALIRFFPRYKNAEQQHILLSWSLVIPLIFVGLLTLFYWSIGDALLIRLFGLNPDIQTYGYMIFAIAIATGLFEVFYSWLRIRLQSVLGNFLKEFYPRLLLFICLILYGFEGIDFPTFLHFVLGGYYLRLLIIGIYAFWIHRPKFELKSLPESKEIIKYSCIILLAGTASSLLLDIDKSMLPALLSVENVAYYSVALFMASVVELPGRAMFQIISPLVAQSIHENNREELQRFLNQSSQILLWGSGFIFLIIALNAPDFYDWIGQPKYKLAVGVVYWVGAAKLSSMALGCLNQIISNSEWYRYSLYFSVGSAVLAILLNYYAIQIWGLMGAAYATFSVIVLINLLKINLISRQLNLTPLSIYTLKIGLLVASIGVVFFQVQWPFDSFWNIALRSIAIVFLYGLLTYILQLHKIILPIVQSLVRRS